MKKLTAFLTILFFFNSFSVLSQGSWITEIPGNTSITRMIHTMDSCYLVLGTPYHYQDLSLNRRTLSITKIDRNGSILWYKVPIVLEEGERFGGNHDNYDIIQLADSSYFMAGWLSSFNQQDTSYSKRWTLRLCKNGDLMWTKYMNVFYYIVQMVEMTNDEIWVIWRSSDNSSYISKLDYDGNIIDEIINPFQGNLFSMQKISDDKLLFNTREGLHWSTTSFFITDTNLNIIHEKTYNIRISGDPPNVSKNLIKQNPVSNYFYAFDNRSSGKYGFLVLNENLDSIDYIPQSTFYPNFPYSFGVYDFIFTSDNNIAMTGQNECYNFSSDYEYISAPFLIVCKINGEPLVTFSYCGVIPEHGLQIFEEETDGGFIMLQEHINMKRAFLVKVYSNGSFSFTYEQQSQLFENMQFYPNPTKQNFTVEINLSDFQNTEIRITTTTGNHIKTKPINSSQTEINTSGWSKGTYICSLYIGKKLVGSGRIVVE